MRWWVAAALALLAAGLVGGGTAGAAVAAGASLAVPAGEASRAGWLPCEARFHRPAHHEGTTLPQVERPRSPGAPPGPALAPAMPFQAAMPQGATRPPGASRQRLYLLYRRLLLTPHTVMRLG
ncbi:hypothetical protein [Inmirania thermothiophila]|uniref:Uncharacterized protein n=1 Tax=Inmirania thermothiophila TaxID=1750597 RepID=A0A3N1Y6H5_9GAMM|nr:hypothetical protein [Inmirania thermothiophila]ROR34385.1 hypothetical protein EDC57_0281 [Inmirania thermothiophila]